MQKGDPKQLYTDENLLSSASLVQDITIYGQLEEASLL